MARCKGHRSHDVQCKKPAGDGGYCKGHQYQANLTNICQGQTAVKNPCYGRVKTGSRYCRESHKPDFVQHVAPRDLREEWDGFDRRERRERIVERDGWLDAYSGMPIVDFYGKHIDHALDLQLPAEAANDAVVKRYDHGQTESQKEVLVNVLRDIINDLEYLRITSASVNVLKGDASTKLIEARRAGDTNTTFTDCMRDAYSSKYPKHRLRQETGSIRKTMLKVSKHQIYRVEDEADDNKLTEAFLKAMKKYREGLHD
ncbi:hypothetical protein PF005_g22158 [Phytophthora fragariae]|uniref:Uncharacterized protein n=1 Tax=Phytophthora fragariae TaxID=53985 RepID=A0A6A3FRH6_9STRA|nr:hypothetical protein PF003_g26873 [Phytophthora fragariae]KAE8947593.1 hypothetical protein PF009_g2795 [Phytophthora fragariae]KAE8984468.1 hypothetical protein PF011_g20768 [Phytophthora fragariae]KAE9082240.1 hypothetical protein PF010_g21670 [Phytophthora fragariae]KAE9082798.1 hypothetical protein PF007_g22161 [Phytophthora fragariae]